MFNFASLKHVVKRLPDRSLLIGRKLVENAKIENFKCDIFSYFQTMCRLITPSLVKAPAINGANHPGTAPKAFVMPKMVPE